MTTQHEQYQLPYHHIGRCYHWKHWLEYRLYLTEILSLIHPRDSVLDVGCGDGRLIWELRRRGNTLVKGIDLDPHAVRWAWAMYLPCEVLDLERMRGWPEWDVVVAMDVLEHIPETQQKAFVASLMKTAGKRVILTVPSTQHKVPPKHYCHFTKEELLQLCPGATVKALWPNNWKTKSIRALDWALRFESCTPWIEGLSERYRYGKEGDALHWLVEVWK